MKFDNLLIMSKDPITNFAAKNGAIIGAGYILVFLLTHVINGSLHTASDISGNINTILLIAGIIIFTKKFRTDYNKTYFSYGEAFKVGFFVALFSAIIGSFYLYIYYSFISPESIEQYLILQQNAFLSTGMPEGQVSQMTEMMKGMLSPGIMAFSSLFGNTLLGLIISLITAAFLKKGTQDPDAFNKSMSELDKKE